MVFAVIVSVILSSESEVLVGATVFYATALYLEARFEYPALSQSIQNTVREPRDVPLDTISISLKISNKGLKPAEDIIVRGRVYDPHTGNATWWTEAQNEDISGVINPGRDRENVQLFIKPDLVERANVVGYDEDFSEDSWVEIEVRTPEQPVASRTQVKVENLRVFDTDDSDELQNALDSVTEKLEEYEQYEQDLIDNN